MKTAQTAIVHKRQRSMRLPKKHLAQECARLEPIFERAMAEEYWVDVSPEELNQAIKDDLVKNSPAKLQGECYSPLPSPSASFVEAKNFSPSTFCESVIEGLNEIVA